MTQQQTFTPKITWTPDGWYALEDDEATKNRRDAYAKQLKADGYHVSKFSHRNCLMSHGGIGSGHPHIEVICNCYGVNYRELTLEEVLQKTRKYRHQTPSVHPLR